MLAILDDPGQILLINLLIGGVVFLLVIVGIVLVTRKSK